MTNFKVFYSNRLEFLYQKLKVQLLQQNFSPFSKKIIIVPSQAVKSWLSLQFANDPDLKICAGFKLVYLDQALDELSEKQNKIPSHFELALAIEIELKKILNEKKDHKTWSPLVNYLKTTFPKKSERMLISLCDTLASLFYKYGKYCGKETKDWENKELFELDWQQQLWKTIFSEYPWSYPSKKYQKFSSDSTGFENISVDLFAMSFLSKIEHQFLVQASEVLPVNYYFLSPCRAFWMDIKSDKEVRVLKNNLKKMEVPETHQKALEHFLRDRNPLLANFGRLGREMITQIDESDPQISEQYELPNGVKGHQELFELIDDEIDIKSQNTPLTLLEAIQSDMLLLRNPENTPKINVPKTDKSIQIHMASSLHREVEILHELIMGIIHDHSHDDEPICPSDIVVMAPDINNYEPYIKYIFSHSNSKIDYQLMDVKIDSQSSIEKGFLYLLQLPKTRWEASSILQLLDFSEFRNKFSLSEDDCQLIKDWILSSGVCWGENIKHRNDLLNRDHCPQNMLEESSYGTWEHGLSSLLLGCAMVLDKSKIENCDAIGLLPSDKVDPINGELLGKFAYILKILREDLKPFTESCELTLSQWSLYLTCILETYFDFDHMNKESKESYDQIKDQINSIARNAKESITITQATFPFLTIEKHLKTLLCKGKNSQRENCLQTVKFCSMLPMRSIPSKVVCLMGMEEGAFPKAEYTSSIDLTHKSLKCDYIPTSIDYDRYLFLEVLLSARQYLVMTYSGNSTDNKEKAYCLIISEILDYLNKFYTIDGNDVTQQCLYKHPFYSFDKRYFARGSKFRSFSEEQFQAAQSQYTKEKIPDHFFFDELLKQYESPLIKNNNEFLDIQIIDIKSLSEVAKDPIKTYFNKKLGIYLKNDSETEITNNESFSMSALDHYIVKKESFSKPAEHILALADKEGYLPSGPFKTLAKERIRKEIYETQQFLKNLDIHSESIFQIELQQGSTSPIQVNQNLWQIPPLTVLFYEKPIRIVGTISNVSLKGLIVQGENKPKDIIKIWPQYLLLHTLSEQFGIHLEKKLLFTKSEIVKDCLIPNHQEYLKRFLEYYFDCNQNPYLILPEWVSDMIKSDDHNFKSTVVKSHGSEFSSFKYNPYLNWSLQNPELLPENSIYFEKWKTQVQYLYGDIFNELFTAKAKNDTE